MTNVVDHHTYSIEGMIYAGGNLALPTATVRLRKSDGEVLSGTAVGEGPIDAVSTAIANCINLPHEFVEYDLGTNGNNPRAIGKVTITIRTPEGQEYASTVEGTDIVQTAAEAYVDALNMAIEFQEGKLIAAGVEH